MTRVTGHPLSLLLGILTIMFVVPVPRPGYTEELKAQPDQASIPELELIKEEETVSIAARHEQPISQAPSNVYVITDEDIRPSEAGASWAEWQERVRRGERWPAHMVETARKIAEREARQARRAETEAW